jgi:type I restriction enzyme S subunit
MEVKPGYKQTEVGVIPDEWEVKSLGQMAELTSSKRIFESDYVPFGIPFYRGKEISMLVEGEVIDDVCYISEARFAAIRAKFGAPVRGNILITAVGTLANVYVVNSDEPFYFKDGNLIWLRGIKDVEAPFLGIQLRRAKAAILDGAIGTSQKALTIVVLRTVKVALPPLPEQRAIAEALSDVDGLLGGLDRLIAKKRDLKQAAMQQLLTGQTRLTGFHGEWEVKRLGDVASVSKGAQLHSSETDEGGKFAHLNGGITPSSYTHKSNTDGNTIAISEGGNSCGFVHFMTEPYWCGGHCYSLIPSGVDNLFLYRALKGQQSAIMGLRVGSGLPNVQKTSLLDFKIELPAKVPEQTAIAEVLTEMDGELAMLEQRREKTRALKQAMMQELLTGRTRLV